MRLRAVGSLLRRVAAATVTAIVLAAAGAEAASSSFKELAETRFDELLRLPQWRQVLRRLPGEAARVRACLRGAECDGAAAEMAELVMEARGRDRMAQLERVHAFVNRQPYREDADQFGREDLWQTPLAFAARGGDCEDYAIAKYFVLKLAGVPDADLRIAVMTSAARDEVHAVMLARVGAEWLVLDNREDAPRSLDSYHDWTPQYAVTQAGGYRYLHAAPPEMLQAPAQR